MKISQNNHLREWWFKRRMKYNIGLLIAGFISFNMYWFLGELLIFPYDDSFEVTLFTIFFQSIGYFFFILTANFFYTFGYFTDRFFNENYSEEFRVRLFNIGFGISVLIPFLIPVLIIIEYFTKYY
ncbi:hypothetical protein [Chryseobacterium sp. SL1]|uniref:hypothetical protein n=1 Tax=Chryseobacterium sp. SL1 TaxID=2995159 RepID=UPI0022731C59|nr:hypothetical protein [Chryseobacterium sp. SL1]MCY1660088.1 hypothetical protein [Chryseobacterium sp. SL1]